MRQPIKFIDGQEAIWTCAETEYLLVKEATYRLEVEGHEIAKGTGNIDQQIPAFGEGVVDVAVHTSLLDLSRGIPALALTGGDWNYEISGILKLAGGFIPVPFHDSGEVEAAQVMGQLLR